MKVTYRPSAMKALNRMPAHDRDAIKGKLVRYAETRIGDVVKMVGTDEFRLRHGDWRAVFVIENDVLVIRIAHRRAVYR
ncbi:type II toxin-antitoxin system RelE family toxin [Jiella sonneratiae]|uniref:Type II toxin-antitoxin system RelE/ParE family toxin n=1 Tax=Jiella sonneratiae TaxID=2816856 RepID=A0ABS3JBP3_9HYPH|nr:type II toxin-antitoxin system RelE/ParE family toxin [Jiella sonneratiae]MBO0906562.1 type II toxin-antitoxin system RelE/ParE family toxin [Jiella sonneratiae]